ncbi:helix-turn-helix transcriptional regulator [Bordetella tumulicola]|uniref:helix-turn-helix transcriptional regulator n=1 Tax=Bordetella tumulicola TaxID=1649133 RepID=UPI0039EEC366
MPHFDQDDSPSHRRPAFYRIVDVLRITALSRATLYRRIADGKFPHPVHLGGRACGWTPSSLQAWIDDPQGYTTEPPCQPRSHSLARRPA